MYDIELIKSQYIKSTHLQRIESAYHVLFIVITVDENM